MTAKFKWNSERDGILRRMKAADAFNWEIGKELGCSAHAVRRRLNRLRGETDSKKVQALPRDAEPCPEGDTVAFRQQDIAFMKSLLREMRTGTERWPRRPRSPSASVPLRITPAPISSGCSSPAGTLADIGRRGGHNW